MSPDTPFDGLLSGQNALDWFIDAILGAGPSPSFIALLLGLTLVGSLYLAGNRDAVVPGVVTVLAGSAMVPLLPTTYRPAAFTIVVVGAAVALYAAVSRYALRGGLQS